MITVIRWVLALVLLLVASVGATSSARALEIPRDDGGPRLTFFWGVGCPHCEEAKPFVAALEAEGVPVERIEVRADPAGRARFLATIERLAIQPAGIPTFVVGDDAVVGFRGGATEREVRALVAQRSRAVIELPIVGAVDPQRISFLGFTLVIGLVDGINPCAIYVLVALLGILLHVKSRSRLVLFGGAFVVVSGVVYFLFMTAWLGVFLLAGVSRAVTIGLGVVLIAMGLVNLKELVWFRKGPSLVIPDRAKPGLFRRMRGIAQASSLPVALGGVLVLAFVVNLVELGCTLGLPAIYTRMLSLRHAGDALARHAWIALYCAAYVVPLSIVVAIFAVSFRRITLTERGAKILKSVSGALLVSFGALFVAAPDVLR